VPVDQEELGGEGGRAGCTRRAGTAIGDEATAATTVRNWHASAASTRRPAISGEWLR
jgi:hypothetical protein